MSGPWRISGVNRKLLIQTPWLRALFMTGAHIGISCLHLKGVWTKLY
jgi:hypothetical protein